MCKSTGRRRFLRQGAALLASGLAGSNRLLSSLQPVGGLPAGVTIPGFHGEIADFRFIEGAQPTGLSSSTAAGSDIDLVAMAHRAMHHLRNNPRPGLDYECRFAMSLLSYPPCPGPMDHDPISIGDTDNRLDWEYGYMKDLCGEGSADEAAAGVRKRILGYLREDGLCWTTQGNNSKLPGTWASSWTTGKLLISLCEDYRRHGDERLRPVCRKMFQALQARADWADGRAYYAGGNSCWDKKGWAITDSSPYHPAMVPEAIAHYYEIFHDQKALDFAVAFAEGEMANDQWRHWILHRTDGLTPEQEAQRKLTSSVALWPTAPPNANLGVRPDGSFDHHSHMRGHLGWGMAHLASITREPRLLAWSKRLLDFFLAQSTDYGYVPEGMTVPTRSETCAVADVINIAECVAKAGYPEYWDVVERFVRNYICEAQFFFSPEYEALYRSRHPGENGERGLAMARDLQGGFQGGMGLADRVNAGGAMDMMGCCVPEGMRSVHTAWINTVRSEKDGVHINMSFDRDAPEARVVSSLPWQGRLEVAAKISRSFLLRPPAWAPRESVRVCRQNTAVPANWRGPYVLVENVRRGETLTLTYPVASFTQRQTVHTAPGSPAITVTWMGNTVMNLQPRGKNLPLYQHVPRPLPELSPA